MSGLKLNDAKNRLKNKLRKIYTGISSGKTSINISVGIPRAIRINIAGEVQLPGTYNFSAFNTLYNALYVAGGITEDASLRDIRLYRNNKLISSVDVYDFLKSGDMSTDVRLDNGDLILVGTYKNRVTIKGNVITPGRFEFIEDESLLDLINYAGGFRENAYRKSVKITRIFDDKLKIVDVNSDQFEFFNLKSGDIVEVGQIINKFENKVVIKGSVYRPGIYSFEEGLSLKKLIEKSEGLKPDTYFEKAIITRTNEDLSTTTISFNLRNELSKNDDQIFLKQDDVVSISSINDLREDRYLEMAVKSIIRIYPYSQNIKLNDLIIIAGGLKNRATLLNIEVSRLKSSNNNDFDKSSEIMYVNLNENNDSFELKPFDHIIVRKDPSIEALTYANIEGEVKYPGKYAISSRKERISDFIERAGGIKDYAYLKGGTLIRKTEFFDKKSETDKQIDDLEKLKDKLVSSSNLSKAEESLLLRVDENINKLKTQNSSNQDFSDYVKKERVSEILERNLSTEKYTTNMSESIGINLESILKNPGSKSDLLVQEGDIIVAQKLETVRLRGSYYIQQLSAHAF